MDYEQCFLIFGDKNLDSVFGQFNSEIGKSMGELYPSFIIDLNRFDELEQDFMFERIKEKHNGIIQVGNNSFSNWNLLASRKQSYTLLVHDLYIWDAWESFVRENPFFRNFDFSFSRVLVPERLQAWCIESGWPLTERTMNSLELLARLMVLSNGVITHSSWAKRRLIALQSLFNKEFDMNIEIHFVPLPFFEPLFHNSESGSASHQFLQKKHGELFVTSLGSHDENRGLLQILAAINKLDNENIKFVVAGKTDSLLKKYVLDVPGGDKVVFADSLSPAGYKAVISTTDVFLNFRIIPYEAASGTLVDSIRTGKPTITNKAGCRMDYEDFENIFYVDSIDCDSILKQLVLAIDSKARGATSPVTNHCLIPDLKTYSELVRDFCIQFELKDSKERFRKNSMNLLMNKQF